jgi:DNA-directed RNA polymerase subunit RPC12/RpoP
LLKTKQFKTNRIIAYTILILGLSSLITSIFFESFMLAFIGLGLTFWGALLLYITPSRYVPLELLFATTIPNLNNIEKILKENNPKGKGIYLPPKYLKDFESSLVFIPLKENGKIPNQEEINDEEIILKDKGMLILPPGLALSKLFEKEIGMSFTKTDLNYIQSKLPIILIEGMEIAEDVNIKTESNIITIEITNHIFKDICQEMEKLKLTHDLLGCPLTSAIACALAKATGKPIIIENEEKSQDGKTMKIQYSIIEENNEKINSNKNIKESEKTIKKEINKSLKFKIISASNEEVCPYCGSLNPLKTQICIFCGETIYIPSKERISCPVCGAPLEDLPKSGGRIMCKICFSEMQVII